jgi:hypothetical protein
MKILHGRGFEGIIVGMALSFVMCVVLASTVFAADIHLSQGQTIYVPSYSYVRIGEKGHQFQLAANLCIRNTDATHAITVVSVNYHDSHGNLLKSYLDKPVDLKPLAAIDFFVRSSDVSGGLAPSFLIKWKSASPANEPIAEAAMIGDKSGQGISFVSTGKVIKDSPD